ncbi:MAG: 5-methyltetrahydropteroyltriglutamate--homocysteine methyltransferase [Gammaproteobacteria bacterium]|nr:5-methyltetrahydropteroyltriglutamate--homocysteine methyltransferase [Gammaproteobacteria bacterium]
MVIAHTLGFPRIGARRELKWALEDYWSGKMDAGALQTAARDLRRRHWDLQRHAGLDLVTAGDFSLYDHVLDVTTLVGAVPARFGAADGLIDLDTYFRMARGRAPRGRDAPACAMTKWFDTNYHYIVPELHAGQRFRLARGEIFEEVADAVSQGHRVKATLVGPLTYLWLSRVHDGEPLALLPELVLAYRDILRGVAAAGAEWVQLDEPILALELPSAWLDAFESAYHRLRPHPLKVMVATYFGALAENTGAALTLPIDGIHVDLVRAPSQLDAVLDRINDTRVLSLGLIDGRNVWRADLDRALELARRARARLGDRIWIAPSCSLLHVPIDVAAEQALHPELRGWLAFATQKLHELTILRSALTAGDAGVGEPLAEARARRRQRLTSPATVNAGVRERERGITQAMCTRGQPHPIRRQLQQARLQLPLLPTTTIGSFPQTAELRRARRDHREGRIDEAAYRERLRAEIAQVIRAQEDYGLDVLVHGEPERGDMVEYFGENLEGVALTASGWVQSYGSRCVRPPIIFGDVRRPRPITVDWTRYAQSLTPKPVKGMLTGPVTLLQWSYARDDLPAESICMQLALAVRDEVMDLEAAGTAIIQIDEPALREGLPLRRRDRAPYLQIAARAFGLCTGGVGAGTQIHTHMCYSEFRDILATIREMDADVVTIEAARSGTGLLQALRAAGYPNDIGPGVYDIHTPRQPSEEEIMRRARQLLEVLPAGQLWLNPDCGLKTRRWEDIEAPLRRLVTCARRLRETCHASVRRRAAGA